MRLQELSKLQMLVRLRGLSDSVTLRMRPDLVWLASGVSVQGGQGLCKVEVTLQASGSAEEAEGAPVVPATYEDRLASYQRVTYEEESLSIWAKLAFTPVTLVLDVAFGALWQALVGEEDVTPTNQKYILSPHYVSGACSHECMKCILRSHSQIVDITYLVVL